MQIKIFFILVRYIQNNNLEAKKYISVKKIITRVLKLIQIYLNLHIIQNRKYIKLSNKIIYTITSEQVIKLKLYKKYFLANYVGTYIKIYKFSGILKLGEDLKSASNFEDFL